MSNISDEDRAMLKYFWEEKGDMTRWVGWEDFCKKHPHETSILSILVDHIESVRKSISNYISDLE